MGHVLENGPAYLEVWFPSEARIKALMFAGEPEALAPQWGLFGEVDKKEGREERKPGEYSVDTCARRAVELVRGDNRGNPKANGTRVSIFA